MCQHSWTRVTHTSVVFLLKEHNLNLSTSVVGRIMPPPQRDVPSTPGTCEHVTLHGKRDFADVITAQTVMGIIPDDPMVSV